MIKLGVIGYGGRIQGVLNINRVKSKAVPLKQCAFLGFQIGSAGRAVLTAKALARFKRRAREITRRNRGHRVQDVTDELRLLHSQESRHAGRPPTNGRRMQAAFSSKG
jgi:hypothetical protein